jgi:competence protein ComEC
MHMFAIDGLRIALVSGMLVMLFRMLRLPRAWCGALAIPLFWFYTAATGWEPSAMRASVMMTIVIMGWLAQRPVDLLNSLAAAAIIILAADPRQLLEASFQLSFFVVLVIGVMLPPVKEFSDGLVNRYLAPDPLLPAELVPRWRKTGVAWARRLAHFCGLSFVAWVGAAPLAAKYFHLFSPVSTPANVVAVPFGAAALMANLGALLCGHWLPWGTALFNHAAWFFMSAMTWVSVEAARLRGAYFYVAEPAWMTVALYYGIIIAAFSGWFRTRRRKLAGTAALLVIAAGYGWHWQAARGETQVTVLPLGGGHAVYVAGGGRDDRCLINCGSEDAVSFTLKDYLRGRGVNSLPRLVLADGSARNCGGAGLADELFGVGGLWTSGVKFRSAAYRDAVARFEAGNSLPAGLRQVSRHHILHLGDTNGCWRMLFPAATENVSRAGDAALVLRGDFHGTRILLLSDLSREGQSQLLAQTNDLRAEIAIAGLPDDGEPVCDALLAAVRPQVVVIADAELPAGRRAGRALRERLERANIPVLYTRTAGAVTIITDRSGWRMRTMDGRPLAGPKAGTFELMQE